MIQECIEEPQQPKPDQVIPTHLSAPFLDFDHFISSLGPLLTSNLKFPECNRYLKLKQTDYSTDLQVIQYFKQVFSKKTSMTVRRKWHIKDKFVLIWVVLKLCQQRGTTDIKMKYEEWDDVENILKLPKEFLMRKWICLIRHTTYHHHWGEQEEETLRKSMQSHELKAKWSDLAINIYKESGARILRTCKDIREHWKNYLDPALKKAVWTQQQDSLLLTLVESNGKKWSLVSKSLEGRTENQVKNRYIAIVKRALKKYPGPQKQETLSPSSSSESSESESLFKVEELERFFVKKEELQDFVSEDVGGELDNYIRMPIYKASQDDGFFIDI